ncbi:MAG: hypothetical protein ABEJ58_05295 [Halodesulfurarchaeum sp.]
MTDERKPVRRTFWERWTDDSGPFYRSCAVFPFDPLTEPDGTQGDAIERPSIQFTSGITRLILRNLPTVLLAVLAVYIPTSLMSAAARGNISVSFSSPDSATFLLGVPLLIVGSLWAYLLYRIAVSSVRSENLHKPLVFILTAVPLAFGTGYAVYSSWASSGLGGEPAITVQAGYFLLVLLAGHLIYDGLALRAENLFSTLGSSTIVEQAEYQQFQEELQTHLGDSMSLGGIEIPRSAAFAGVFILIPTALPLVSLGWNVWAKLAFIPYSFINFFVVAITYDTFVLIHTFTELLGRDILMYRPYHPDEHGGFRDLGRFATRVNLILVVVGGYVAYRFYAEGVFTLPVDGFTSPLLALTWGISYVGPILAYIVFVVYWLYHSFWRLHSKMERGRQKHIEEIQQRNRADEDSASREFSDPNTDGPVWESLQSAPRWPIKRQGLLGIVMLDAIPVLVPILL